MSTAAVNDAVRRCASARAALLAAVRRRMTEMCQQRQTCTNLNTDCGLQPSLPITGVDAQLAATSLRRVAELTATSARNLFEKFDDVSKNGLEALKQLVSSGGWPEKPGTPPNPMLFQPATWAPAWLPYDVGTGDKDQVFPYSLTLTKIGAGVLIADRIRTLTIKGGVIFSYDPSKIPANIKRNAETCSPMTMPEAALRTQLVITADSTLQPDLKHVADLAQMTTFTITGRAVVLDGKPVAARAAEISFRKTPGETYTFNHWRSFICAMHIAIVQASVAAQSDPAKAASLVVKKCEYLLTRGTTNSVALSRLTDDKKSASLLRAGKAPKDAANSQQQ